ncbi:MAG: alpha/beta hydrolase [Acidimicrobiia bacterium]|nr:alpha/beta hydrolase [Acidimicrobiia bacterium]
MTEKAVPETVTFDSDGYVLEALLYRPGTPGPHPLVVMAGGWCYVKELAQPRFAERFAAAGLASLIFDYRNCGGSSGEVRQHLDPWEQIRDYRNAVTFAENLSGINVDQIGAWGISYSGGHVLILGAIDSRVKAVCGVVPVVDGYENMRLAHGTLGLRRLQEYLLDARRRKAKTGEITTIEHQPLNEGEIATWPFPKSKQVFAKLKADQAPAYVGHTTTESTELLLTYSVFPYLDRLLGLPMMMVMAEGDDHTHWDLAGRAFESIPGQTKTLSIVPSSNHLTLYSDEQQQQRSASEIAGFFVESLAVEP